MKYQVFVIILLVTTGCASFTSPARKHELDPAKSYLIDYDVTRRGTILSGAGVSWKACAEPAPDAAIGVVAKLEGNLEVAGQGAVGGKGELNQSIVKLAEKTQMVLFLRESLFRLCELSVNTDISADQAKELYESVLDSALALVEKEREEIKLEQQRLAIADQAQFIFQFLSEKGVDQGIIENLLEAMP